jgi:tRNA A-37 threonylcarbamoyl transferase component Bud32
MKGWGVQEADGSNTDAIGTLIGDRYVIEALLGRGGMASVYRAHDETLGRTVAVKVFRTDVADPEHLRRKTSEVRLLASLNHYSLVTLFDASIDPDVSRGAYIVMELIDGPTLRDRIAEGALPAAEVAAMTADLGEALHVVHDQGVVHRDIKPSNVLLSPSPSTHREFRAKLADFGIAYLIDSAHLTAPGTLIGTAAYVSPEQAQGAAPTPATDIYSLGLVLLESFTAKRAFPGPIMESVTARLVTDPEVPDALGPGWRPLLKAMTARDPDDRPTAIEVADAARELERKEATSEVATQLTPVVGGGVGGGVGGAAPTASVPVPPVPGPSQPTFTEAFLMPPVAASGSAAPAAAAGPSADGTEPDPAELTRVLPVLDPDAVVPPTTRLHLAEGATGVTERIGAAPGGGAAGGAAGGTSAGPGAVGALSAGAASLGAGPAGSAAPTDATELMHVTRPEAATRTGATSAVATKPSSRGATVRWLIIVAIALLVIAGTLLAVWLSGAFTGAGQPAPTLPPIDGPLGDHLRQLLKDVTP